MVIALADFEIPSDFIKPMSSLNNAGGENRIKKMLFFNSPVTEKEIGKFKKNDPKLRELEKEAKFIHEICKCRFVLTFYGFTRRNTNYSVIYKCGEYNLQTYLVDYPNLEWTKKLSIASGIANALNFIHKDYILHNDIRSCNIYLNACLQVKLHGFRVAKSSKISPVMLTSASEPTDHRWTPSEKFRDNEYTDASEIYSFSLILWEIINHKTPFHDVDYDEIKNKVLNGEHPQPVTTNGTPVEYQEIMEKGWDIDPNKRPSAKQMLEILCHLESKEWLGHRTPRIGDDEQLSQPNFKTSTFSPMNSKLLEFPISRLSDLAATTDSCETVLKLFEEAKYNRNLFDRSVNIIKVGKIMLSEVKQTIDQSINLYWKDYIEESSAFQRYSNYLLNILQVKAFIEDGDNAEVQQEISTLNDELESITNELHKVVQDWKSEFKRCRVSKGKFKAVAKMLILYKSVSPQSIIDCEIPSYFVDVESSSVVLESNIKKGLYMYSASVAEKVVGNFEKNDPKLLELREEIDYLKSMSECENILKVYGLVRRNSSYSVILKWGEYNLQPYLAKNPNMEWTKKLSIARGIANALNFIHKENILHYDIKSDNIYLDIRLQPKLCGFRIAKDLTIMMTSANEPTNPRWTSSEKFRGEEYTKASEIYSFSLILWEIINHKVPFHNVDPDEIKTKVLSGAHPQPETINNAPVKYQRIMKRGWDLDPRQRPSIEEIIKVLNELDSEWHNSYIGDEDNKLLSPNAAFRDDVSFEDNASSFYTDFSNSNYGTEVNLNVTTQISKKHISLDKLNPFHKHLDIEDAIILHNNRQYKKAWKLFKEIERKTGTPDAKFCVGYYYLQGFHNGRGGIPDPDASLKYLYQAAKDGHRNAQYWYAEILLNSNYKIKAQKFDRDYKLAMVFLGEAAKQGSISALRDLGEIKKKGKYGSSHDHTVGKEMIRKAHTMSLLYSLDGLR
ncbi:15304_t:CDS:2 [Funneliformis geosporum]|uniref:19727_t:CDS:1 n=1 Tax=Funneliformis geosporum TaxID=1117311 RepID=A0A9W4SP50_9GLOM|nr:15304_t:CDS:2 [Funneliformis geosporum]CAI2174123.1 19727_t:CDS:2 [Funneliformis geosporum]